MDCGYVQICDCLGADRRRRQVPPLVSGTRFRGTLAFCIELSVGAYSDIGLQRKYAHSILDTVERVCWFQRVQSQMSSNSTCSGHGYANSIGNCICDAGFVLHDCSGQLQTGSVFQAYLALSWLLVIASFVLAAVSVQRFIVVMMSKKKSLKHTNSADSSRTRHTTRSDHEGPLWTDAQLQIITLLFISSLINGVVWLDFYGVHGWFTNSWSVVAAWDAALIVVMFAGTRTIHVFISIYAKFDPPSRHVANGLTVLSVVVGVLFLIGAGLLSVSSSAHLITTLAAALFLIILSAGVSVYALKLLRVSRDPNIARTHSAAERDSRSHLIKIMRALQLLAIFGLAVAIWGTAAAYNSVANDLAYHSSLSLTLVVAVVGLLLVMGRSRNRSQQLETASLVTIQIATSPSGGASARSWPKSNDAVT